MAVGHRLCVIVLWALLSLCQGQNNPFFNSNNNNNPDLSQAQGNTYYFDSASDCNLDSVRNIYNVKATIKGHDSTGGVGRGVESCTIKIKSEGQFDGKILHIVIIAMDIRDPDTQVAIYDGDAAQMLLGSFNQRSNQNPNRETMKTSGNTATFIMTRQNVEQLNFNIHIEIKPIQGGVEPGYENGYGNYDTFDKFPQETIVGLIGGFYLAMILVITVVLILYYRSLKGRDKKWETVQLDVMKTNTRFDTSRSSQPPSYAWSTDLGPTKGPPASQYSRGYSTADPYPRKYPHGEEDGGAYRYDDTFQRKRLMNGERDRIEPPRYATNNTFEDPEEEDDPDHFEEKVITPRVRTNKSARARPPSYEEAVSSQESESERSSDEKSEESSDESIHKRSISSEERSRSSKSTRTETESETESEEDSEVDSRRGRGARGGRKPRRKENRRGRKPPSSDGEGPSRRRRLPSSDDEGPSRRRQQPAQQPPAMAQPPMAAGYYPPGQFVPVMAGPQFQPVPIVPAYAPPQYPENRQPPQVQGPQPTEPPVYSYLVRRGYTPLDARSASQGSVSGSQRSEQGKLEEPDVRLNSGVEYMRR